MKDSSFLKKGDLTAIYKATKVLKKECETCGIWYGENKKHCPHCREFNKDYFEFGREHNWMHNIWKPED